MDSVILILVCLFAGLGLQRVKAIPANAYIALNQLVIYLLLPALSLYYVPKIPVSEKILYPVAVGWGSFLLSWLFFGIVGKVLKWPKKLQGCLILTSGFLNSSFIGFPVIEALYGRGGLTTAILVDQPGTFVMLSTLGIVVAIFYSKGRPSGQDIIRRVLLFPPFIAFITGLIINICHYDFTNPVQSMLQRLGSCVTPVALVAVGLQLKIARKSPYRSFLALGLFVKLLLVPAFFLVLYKIIFGLSGKDIDISVMEAATPPMITAAIIASAHGLKPRLAGMMIGVGIPLSFLTMAFWYFALKHW